MAYTRVNWNSTTTYVSAENLNVMDKGIMDLDNTVADIKTSIGDVTALTTTAKTVVPAINEIKTGLNTVNNNLTSLIKSKSVVIGNTLDETFTTDTGGKKFVLLSFKVGTRVIPDTNILSVEYADHGDVAIHKLNADSYSTWTAVYYYLLV
ncbi:hypothetical protein [Anaerosporobacter sp.]